MGSEAPEIWLISDIWAVREMYPALRVNTKLFQQHLDPFTAVSLRKTGMDDTTKLLLTDIQQQ